MIKHSAALRNTCAAFAALGLVAGSLVPMHHAVAQSIVTQSDEQITIGTPRTVHHEFAGRTATGMPVDDMSLSRRVSTADLNLNNPADRYVLEQRIKFAVDAACNQLGNAYPDSFYPPVPGDRDCHTQALNDGMSQARMLLASSR